VGESSSLSGSWILGSKLLVGSNRTCSIYSDYDVEPLAPNTTEPVREAVDLSDLLKVLASRIEDFKELLIVPRSVVSVVLKTISTDFYASYLTSHQSVCYIEGTN
jgi:hypothetical protein